MFGFFYFWNMFRKSEYEVSIYQGKRVWYELVLASFFYGISIYLLMSVLYYAFIDQSAKMFIKSLFLTLAFGLYSLAMGLRYSIIKNTLIDSDNSIIVSRYVVGPFSYDIKSKVDKFEYVSFFEDKTGYFGTHLWYTGNRHYKMYGFEDKDSAYKFSLEISNKLNIDLLDATEKGNFKWLEK